MAASANPVPMSIVKTEADIGDYPGFEERQKKTLLA
jgi:hypothetical protein